MGPDMGAKRQQNSRCPDQPGLSPSQLLHRLFKSRSQLQECRRSLTPLGSSPREDARSQERDNKDQDQGAAMKPTSNSGRQQEARAPESRTFHYFTSLAPEIRIAIWECYFRDNLLPPPRLHDLMPYKCWHAECASKPASSFGSERILERHVLSAHSEEYRQAAQAGVPCIEIKPRHSWLAHLRLRTPGRTEQKAKPQPQTACNQPGSLSSTVPLINHEAWSVARGLLRGYEQAELNFRGPTSGTLLKRPALLANWDVDVLFLSYVGFSRQAELLTNNGKEDSEAGGEEGADGSDVANPSSAFPAAAPWAAKVQRLAVEMPVRRYTETEEVRAYMRTLVDLACALPGLREIQLLPLGAGVLIPWDGGGSYPVDSYWEKVWGPFCPPPSPDQLREEGSGLQKMALLLPPSASDYMVPWRKHVSAEMGKRESSHGGSAWLGTG